MCKDCGRPERRKQERNSVEKLKGTCGCQYINNKKGIIKDRNAITYNYLLQNIMRKSETKT